MKNWILEEEKSKIVADFLNGVSEKELAAKYAHPIKNIRRLLINKGARKAKKKRTPLCKRYDLNESYFDIIDSNEKARWLGWLYADGYNNSKDKIVVLGLQKRDIAILEDFNRCIGSNRPIICYPRKNPKQQDLAKLIMSSSHICQRLWELGCVPKKSLILEFPTEEQVPKQHLKAFIRGYFEGNGSVSFYLNKGRYLGLWTCIVSTENFCKQLDLIVKEELSIKSYIHHPNKSRGVSTRTWCVSGCVQARKFLAWLYDGAENKLERKYETFQKAAKAIDERNAATVIRLSKCNSPGTLWRRKQKAKLNQLPMNT